MKRILITGTNSYIGTSFEKWISKWSDDYFVDSIDVKNDDWQTKSFKEYDVVLHVAGIAHVTNNSTYKNKYFSVNRDLAISIAKKCKKESVGQFIFMSSIIIYGNIDSMYKEGVINSRTNINPIDLYGRSKMEADLKIQSLNDNAFKTVIVRSIFL